MNQVQNTPRAFHAQVLDDGFGRREKRTASVGERLHSGLMRSLARMGFMQYANFPADLQATVDGPAYGFPPATRAKVNRQNGRVRYFNAVYRAPASGAAPAIADKIVWGKLPVGARILGHLSRLDFHTGTASCTLNLGDQFVAASHLAATAITATGSATPSAATFTTTAVADVTINSTTLSGVKSLGAFTVGGIVTGTGIPTGAYVTAVDKQAKTVTISAAATATNAAVTITTFGAPFETSDDTSNIANAYASTTDDCTLISTVAGAQIANNQMLSLQIAYVCD